MPVPEARGQVPWYQPGADVLGHVSYPVPRTRYLASGALMSTSSVDAGACALFLMAAFVLAGCAQVAWLASPWSRRLHDAARRRADLPGPAHLRRQQDRPRLRGDGARHRAGVRRRGRGWPDAATRRRSASGRCRPVATRGSARWRGSGSCSASFPTRSSSGSSTSRPAPSLHDRAAAAWQLVADRLDSGLGMLVALSLGVPRALEGRGRWSSSSGGRCTGRSASCCSACA